MLKHNYTIFNGKNGLITVQDNTMLKLAQAYSTQLAGLITVQDNTMLKPRMST